MTDHCAVQKPDVDRRDPGASPCGRRDACPFTDEKSIEDIAERAAAKAVQKITDGFYRDVGRGVVARLLWIVGVVATAAYFWLTHKDWIKP